MSTPQPLHVSNIWPCWLYKYFEQTPWEGLINTLCKLHILSLDYSKLIIEMFVALVHSQSILCPVKNNHGPRICVFLNQPWSCKNCYMCTMLFGYVILCLDMEVFPQISQEWVTLVMMWLVSMCVFMFAIELSFPHTKHILALRVEFPIVSTFSLISIIDLTSSSNCWTSVLTMIDIFLAIVK